MSKEPPATKITRGYARDQKDFDRLKAAGVKTIYRADKGETLDKFRLRAGETLGVVDGLRAFGKHSAKMRDAVKTVHGWGASIVDVDSGLNSRSDGVEMHAKATIPASLMTPERAREMQEASAKKRTDGRWSPADAKRAWHSGAIKDGDEFKALTGWPPSTAYNKFGPRFAVRKRPRGKE